MQTMRAIGHGAHALLGSVNGVFGASLAKAELLFIFFFLILFYF